MLAVSVVVVSTVPVSMVAASTVAVSTTSGNISVAAPVKLDENVAGVIAATYRVS